MERVIHNESPEQPRNWKVWTDEEALLFKKLRKFYDKDYNAYLPHFKDRTYNQIKSHYHNECKRQKGRLMDRMAIGDSKYGRKMKTSQPERDDAHSSVVESNSQYRQQSSEYNSSCYNNLDEYIQFGK